jgi:hypothetical protein
MARSETRPFGAICVQAANIDGGADGVTAQPTSASMAALAARRRARTVTVNAKIRLKI